MRRTPECLVMLGVGLLCPIQVGCSTPAPDDDAAGDETTADESTDAESTDDETTDDETTDDETTDDETGDDETGDGDTGDGDPNPKPCTWTNFPSQYGIAPGQSCGALSGYDATLEDLELVFACLQDAYDAEQAAYATLEWYDDGDNDHRAAWYVRPPKDSNPRRIEAQYFKQYVEEGPSSTGKWTVTRCSNFVIDCPDFPGFVCTACTQPVTMVCGTTEQ